MLPVLIHAIYQALEDLIVCSEVPIGSKHSEPLTVMNKEVVYTQTSVSIAS